MLAEWGGGAGSFSCAEHWVWVLEAGTPSGLNCSVQYGRDDLTKLGTVEGKDKKRGRGGIEEKGARERKGEREALSVCLWQCGHENRNQITCILNSLLWDTRCKAPPTCPLPYSQWNPDCVKSFCVNGFLGRNSERFYVWIWLVQMKNKDCACKTEDR